MKLVGTARGATLIWHRDPSKPRQYTLRQQLLTADTANRLDMTNTINRRILLLLGLLLAPTFALAEYRHAMQIWPTIPFVRGKDLCQYQEAYSKSKNSQSKSLLSNVIALMREGAQDVYAIGIVQAIDEMENLNRARAASGLGMDVLLEGSFKAALDGYYRDVQPAHRQLSFFNPLQLTQLVRTVRDQKRQGYLDEKLVKDLQGIFWGTYSFGPGCTGNVLVTLHLEDKDGETYSFQGQGLPQSVMHALAGQIFEYFQRTKFPSKVAMGKGTLEVLGAPGAAFAHTPDTPSAERVCKQMSGRLPTAEELEYVNALGDWNGGITLRNDIWALQNNVVYAPDLPNPSPVRKADEIRGQQIHFYCVR